MEEPPMLQLISVLLMAYSYFLIRTNLPHLPARIPTHFNAAGAADGWGSPDTLWILLGVQILSNLVFLLVPFLSRRYPGLVHLGTRNLSDYTPAQRTRILPLLSEMTALMGVVMNLFFSWVLNQIIKAVTQPIPHIAIVGPMVLLIGGSLVLTFYYLARIRRAAAANDAPGTGQDG
jgi:uncharacterized membrane protein